MQLDKHGSLGQLWVAGGLCPSGIEENLDIVHIVDIGFFAVVDGSECLGESLCECLLLIDGGGSGHIGNLFLELSAQCCAEFGFCGKVCARRALVCQDGVRARHHACQHRVVGVGCQVAVGSTEIGDAEVAESHPVGGLSRTGELQSDGQTAVGHLGDYCVHIAAALEGVGAAEGTVRDIAVDAVVGILVIVVVGAYMVAFLVGELSAIDVAVFQVACVVLADHILAFGHHKGL